MSSFLQVRNIGTAGRRLHLRNVNGGYGPMVTPRHVAIQTFGDMSNRSWCIALLVKGDGKGTAISIAYTVKEGKSTSAYAIFRAKKRFRMIKTQ